MRKLRGKLRKSASAIYPEFTQFTRKFWVCTPREIALETRKLRNGSKLRNVCVN